MSTVKENSWASKTGAWIGSIRSKLTHKPGRQPSAGDLKLNDTQRRILPVVVILATLAGVFLVATFVPVVLLAAIAAIILYPFYIRLNKRMQRPGAASALTFVCLLLIIIIPFVFIIALTVSEAKQLISSLQAGGSTVTLSTLSSHLLEAVNKLLDTLTRGTYQITITQIQEFLARSASSFVAFFLDVLTSSFSSISGFITRFILFIYLFTAMLTHANRLKEVFSTLNPLGEDISTLYMKRTAAMVRGAVGGQLIIAVCQGFAEAGILYIAGIHNYTFLLALILTVLSIIPLGGGIVAIPIGIILLLTGHVWQGLVVLLGHFLIITNIDNVLRPQLVPVTVRINSALMLLSVFGGIARFGFMGIVIGPVIMILVLSTLEVYLPFAKGQKT